jgi:hypothetical protein
VVVTVATGTEDAGNVDDEDGVDDVDKDDVDVEAVDVVLKLAACNLAIGQPLPLHGSVSQQPWNVGDWAEQVYQRPIEQELFEDSPAESDASKPAGLKSAFGQPASLHGSLVQHPKNDGICDVHSYLITFSFECNWNKHITHQRPPTGHVPCAMSNL